MQKFFAMMIVTMLSTASFGNPILYELQGQFDQHFDGLNIFPGFPPDPEFSIFFTYDNTAMETTLFSEAYPFNTPPSVFRLESPGFTVTADGFTQMDVFRFENRDGILIDALRFGTSNSINQFQVQVQGLTIPDRADTGIFNVQLDFEAGSFEKTDSFDPLPETLPVDRLVKSTVEFSIWEFDDTRVVTNSFYAGPISQVQTPEPTSFILLVMGGDASKTSSIFGLNSGATPGTTPCPGFGGMACDVAKCFK